MNLISCKAWNLYHEDNFDIGLFWDRAKEFIDNRTSLNVVSSVDHIFDNGGFTGLYLLSESHFAVHYWIEYKYIWVELSSCGSINDFKAFEEFFNLMNCSFETDYKTQLLHGTNQKLINGA